MDDEARSGGTTRKRFLETSGSLIGAAALNSLFGSATARGTEQTNPDTGQKKPNILLITTDDLGQRLESYGVDTVETPTINALAEEGVKFENAFTAAPSCGQSRAALATGRSPHSNGQMGHPHSTHDWRIDDTERHIASFLSDQGYSTHLFGKFHVAPEGYEELNSEAAKALGFDNYPTASNDETEGSGSAKALIQNVRKYLDDLETEKPVFLEINFHEPHRLFGQPNVPFTKPDVEPSNAPVSVPDYLPDNQPTRDELSDLRAAIRQVDTAVNDLYDYVTCSDRFGDNTLSLFTSDQGIAMPRSKPTVFDPGIEIPIIAYWPAGGLTGGESFSELVSIIDLMPTMLQAAGIDIPKYVEGKSLLPLARGEEYSARDVVFTERTSHTVYVPIRAARTEQFKLVRRFGKILHFQFEEMKFSPTFNSAPMHFFNSVPPVPPAVALYDLESDPLEQHNLVNESGYQDIKQQLERRLYSWMRRTEDPILSGPIATPYYQESLREFKQAGKPN